MTIGEIVPAQTQAQTVYENEFKKQPAKTIEHFEINDPASGSDYFSLALAYFSNGEFNRALDNANRALAICPDDASKAVCYQLVAQCHGANQKYELGAEAALKGLRLAPESKDLAVMRLVYAKNAKDELGAMVADEYLSQLDKDYKRNPKCDPITGAVIVIGILCLAATVTSFSDNKESAAHLASAVEHIIKAATGIAIKSGR